MPNRIYIKISKKTTHQFCILYAVRKPKITNPLRRVDSTGYCHAVRVKVHYFTISVQYCNFRPTEQFSLENLSSLQQHVRKRLEAECKHPQWPMDCTMHTVKNKTKNSCQLQLKYRNIYRNWNSPYLKRRSARSDSI